MLPFRPNSIARKKSLDCNDCRNSIDCHCKREIDPIQVLTLNEKSDKTKQSF